MSDSKSRDGSLKKLGAEVAPLWTDVVLDDAAMDAQRLALLAELAAERFQTGLRAGARKSRLELAAARHLARGATLARNAAEEERSRCASRYGGAVDDARVS